MEYAVEVQNLSKHFGREPTTSARPPVLIKGTASDATNKIFFMKKPPSPYNPFAYAQLLTVYNIFQVLGSLICIFYEIRL